MYQYYVKIVPTTYVNLNQVSKLDVISVLCFPVFHFMNLHMFSISWLIEWSRRNFQLTTIFKVLISTILVKGYISLSIFHSFSKQPWSQTRYWQQFGESMCAYQNMKTETCVNEVTSIYPKCTVHLMMVWQHHFAREYVDKVLIKVTDKLELLYTVTYFQETTYTNQFSVTKHQKTITGTLTGDSGLPGVFFMYELSPMMVKYTEKNR